MAPLNRYLITFILILQMLSTNQDILFFCRPPPDARPFIYFDRFWPENGILKIIYIILKIWDIMLRITSRNVDDFAKSRNTVAAKKPDGNGENKHQPAASGETGLLDSINSITGARGM